MPPKDFIQNLVYLKRSQVSSFHTVKSRPPYKTRWSITNEIKPVDLYCYLWARFGEPNGIMNFTRNNSSDNLLHWDWLLRSGTRFIWITGMNFRTELAITSDEMTEEWQQEFINGLKEDFAKYGPSMGSKRSKLEQWTEFLNPYTRVKTSIERLMDQIKELNLPSDEDLVSDPRQNREDFTIQSQKFSQAMA